NYPAAARTGEAAVSAGSPRKLFTGPREVVLSARGEGGAPRFKLTSHDGRTFEVPRDRDIVRTKRHMIVVDEANNVTHVAAGKLARGNWTITPYGDSVPILGVKTGKALPPERVRARVTGKGLNRTLVWDSTGNPNTRLSFTEVMKDGSEQPILNTDEVEGRYRFKATKGSHYGKRRLRAYVVHGNSPREVTIEDAFAVARPGRLGAPRRVSASRNVYKAGASWSRVAGAHGYVAEIAVRKKGRKISSYRREVGPKVRKIAIPSHPGGGWAEATVQALNADGVPGRSARKRFRLAPPKSLNLRQAARRSAVSAKRAGKAIRVRAICPTDGHCQTKVLLRLRGRTIGAKTFQQVPGTFRTIRVSPAEPGVRRRLAQGRLYRLKVLVRQNRSATASAGKGIKWIAAPR
ncbi:MAG: hypothetical protein M3Y45_07620, partial [Actinomycetota bacterium]|nr:hypothetical protein [Actinomycetota bacterium]